MLPTVTLPKQWLHYLGSIVCASGHKADRGVLGVARFQAAECGLSNASRSTEVIIVMSVLYGVAALFVLLRVTSKLMTRTFCVEDHMIIYAVLLATVPFVCILYSEFLPSLDMSNWEGNPLLTWQHSGQLGLR